MNTLDVIKPYTCTVCGKTFIRKFNLMRHKRTLHGDESYSEDEDSEGIETEDNTDDNESDSNDSLASEMEEDESLDEESSDELDDNAAYKEWFTLAKETTEEMRTKKYDKYINEGMEEDRAKEKAYTKTLWVVKRIFFEDYLSFLWSNIHLKDNDTHQEIMADLEENLEKGVDINKALKRVIAKHRAKFDVLFDEEEEEEMQETDSSD